MKTINQYGESIRENLDNPVALARIHNDMTTDVGELATILKPLLLKRSQEWINIKMSNGDKPLSDKFTDMKFNTTPNGELIMELEFKIKMMEKMMQSISKTLRIAELEARNQI